MYASPMRRKASTVVARVATLAFGFCLTLVSGCATGDAGDAGETARTGRSAKHEKVYSDPAYKGTNRRRSQTHAAPFR